MFFEELHGPQSHCVLETSDDRVFDLQLDRIRTQSVNRVPMPYPVAAMLVRRDEHRAYVYTIASIGRAGVIGIMADSRFNKDKGRI